MTRAIACVLGLGLLFLCPDLSAQSDGVRFPYGLGPAAQAAARPLSVDPQTESERPPVAPVAPRRFWTAAGEIVLLEVGPWAVDRYISNEDFAHISFETIKKNFQTGFEYDGDHFDINQSSHPYHGSLFFMAARSNGYGFWESGAFALAGSLIWECCMENTAPSVNDLVNTTLGGMTRGEVSHRLSTMIRDNTSTGGERVWRELGAAILDPVGALTRLVHGDWKREYVNPEDRFPSRVAVSADLGYRRVADSGVTPDQGILSLSAYYGNPFAGEIVHPFDSFWAGIDLNTPGNPWVTRIEERGILKGWELTSASEPIRHIVGFSQEYEYFNNASQVFGAQLFGAGVLSQYRMGARFQATTDAGLVVIPLAGIQTTNAADPKTGRNYDYGVGGGVRVGGRLFRDGRQIADVGYAAAWTHTVNGSSDGNTLQYFRGSLRVPIREPVGVGAGYSWYSRKTVYANFFDARKTQSEWRVFLDLAYGRKWSRAAGDAR